MRVRHLVVGSLVGLSGCFDFPRLSSGDGGPALADLAGGGDDLAPAGSDAAPSDDAAPASDGSSDGGGPISFAAAVSSSVSGGPVAVRVGDLDNDTHLDVALIAPTTATLLLRYGSGSLALSGGMTLTTDAAPSALALANLNTDATLDVVVSTGTNLVDVFASSGARTYKARTTVGAPQPGGLALADLAGKGHADLVVPESGAGKVGVAFGDGSGGFANLTSYGAGTQPLRVAIGDFDGDTHLDVAAANATGAIAILQNLGSGTLGNAKSVPLPSAPRALVAGDFDGDGAGDLVASLPAASRVAFLKNVSGSFGTPPPALSTTGGAPVALAVADFDLDNALDLAVADGTGQAVTILRGSGDGRFTVAATIPLGAAPTDLDVGDLDEDGHVDVVAVAAQPGALYVIRNTTP